MMRNPPPRSAVIAMAGLAIIGFAALLPLAVLGGMTTPQLLALPVVFVVLLWAFPALKMAWQGERWMFVVVLALLIFATDGNFRARSWADKSLDWQVAMKLGVWMLAGLVGAMHFGRAMRAGLRPPAIFALMLVGLLVASTAWSPNWAYTLVSSVSYAAILLFALAMAESVDENDVILGLLMGFGALVVLSVMVAPFGLSLAGPSPGSTAAHEDRLAGITDHPIGLAIDSSVAILVAGLALHRGIGRKWICWGVIVAALLCLILARSRMPAMAMGLAWILAYAHARGILLQVVMLSVAVCSMIGLVTVGTGWEGMIPDEILRLLSRSGNVGEIMTLTGRVDIWRTVLQKVGDHPLLGHGFASGMQVLHDFRRWNLTHAHNGFLQALLYVGWVGLSIMVAAQIGQIVAFVRQSNVLRDSLAFFLIFLAITETSMLSNLPSSSTVLFMFAMAYCAAGQRSSGVEMIYPKGYRPPAGPRRNGLPPALPPLGSRIG